MFSIVPMNNGVFTLPDSDSDGNGCDCFLRKSVQWTYADSKADSYSDADGYCTQFDTNIGTDKVIFIVNLYSESPSESV